MSSLQKVVTHHVISELAGPTLLDDFSRKPPNAATLTFVVVVFRNRLLVSEKLPRRQQLKRRLRSNRQLSLPFPCALTKIVRCSLKMLNPPYGINTRRSMCASVNTKKRGRCLTKDVVICTQVSRVAGRSYCTGSLPITDTMLNILASGSMVKTKGTYIIVYHIIYWLLGCLLL